MYNQSEEYKEKQRTNKPRKRSNPDKMDKEKLHKQSEEYKGKQRANQQRKRSDPDIRKKENKRKRLNLEINIVENFQSNVLKGP